MPAGIIVRRSFSFQPGEKSWANRVYRRAVDAWLGQRYKLTDYFFSLPPLQQGRIRRMVDLAASCSVEIETHPINADEYEFLRDGRMLSWCGAGAIARGYDLNGKVCN